MLTISRFSTKKNEDYWRNRKIDWVSHYFSPDHPHRDFLIKILKTSPPKSVLEIGMGCGANLWRIKKEFPNARVCGCDINPDAIKTADEVFRKEYPTKHFERPAIDSIADIDFRVGDITAIPFHGEFFDMVITDACLIYIGPDKMDRAIREIRRVGYYNFLFVEFHSDKWWKRLALKLASRYYAYDYFKLLSDNYFKGIKLTKVPKEHFGGEPWNTYGYFITSGR